MQKEHIDNLKTLWLAIGQVIIFIVLLKRSNSLKKILPFVHRESVENIEKKIFSFDEALNAKIITDEDGIISSMNTAAERIFRYKEKELQHKNFNELVPEDKKKHFSDMLARTKGKEMEDKTSRLDGVKKYGTTFPVEMVLRKRPIGEHYFYLIIIRDRTNDEQMAKKFEQLIRIQKIKLDILSRGEEIGQAGSWLWDVPSGDITASENYKKIIGLTSGTNYRIDEIKLRVWDSDKKIVDDGIDKAFAGENYDITYRLVRARDLKVLHLRSQATPIKDSDGIPIAIYGSTRLLKMETLLEAAKNERFNDAT